jgi:hypothetical protein
LDLGGSIINMLNQKYIADAQNNGNWNQLYQNKSPKDRGYGFDATSATVYFAQGLRWNVNVAFNF